MGIVAIGFTGSYVPEYAHDGDAGFDLRSTESLCVPPGKTRLVKTGLRVALPEGYELQIRPRSGLALNHGITVLNSPGTVDSGYRGEICVILMNHGEIPFDISIGDRIAQAVVSKYEVALFVFDENLGETERGEKGFGSSGVSDDPRYYGGRT